MRISFRLPFGERCRLSLGRSASQIQLMLEPVALLPKSFFHPLQPRLLLLQSFVFAPQLRRRRFSRHITFYQYLREGTHEGTTSAGAEA